MSFVQILKLLYIRGYFKSQAAFLRELFKMSVDNKETIILSDSALKGYFQGNSITELAPVLIDAGLDPEKTSEYIEQLYLTKHKDTPTFTSKYNGKTYKEALYEKAKLEFGDIRLDNMSMLLANKFYEIIQAAYQIESDNSNKEIIKSVNKIKKRHAKKIENIIEHIEKLCRTMVYWYETDYKIDAFEKKYTEYKNLNVELSDYGIIYPHIDNLQKIHKNILSERDFFVFDEEKPYLEKYNNYFQLLIEIRKELNTLEEE